MATVAQDGIARRQRRLGEQMPARGLDALLATDPVNVRYATGLASVGDTVYADTPLWAVVPASGPVRVIPAAIDLPALEGLIDADLVHPHGRFTFRRGDGLAALADFGRPLMEAVRDALRAAGARRVGVDRPCSALDAISGTVEVHAAGSAFQAARRVKDEEELACLRAANRAIEGAALDALARCRTGTTERQLARWIQVGVIERDGRPTLCVVGFGANGAIPERWPSDRALERGDVIRLDLGATVDGYHADIARTAVCGRSPAETTATCEALLAGERAAEAACRPGATAAEVFAATIRSVRDAGLTRYEREHCGHGIGLDCYEAPLVAAEVDDLLEPGMTLCVETPYYELGRYGAQFEHAVVVTADGAARLGAAETGVIEVAT